jgi:N-carbamoylputrescine amidase
MNKEPLTLGLVQHGCSEDKNENLQTSIAGVAEAAARGAQLVLLQELHATRYFCQQEDPALFDLAEPIPGPTSDLLTEAAREHEVCIVGSIFERRAAGVYFNTAVVVDRDGRIAGRYRKMHIPDDPGYSEKFYFSPGDLGFTPIDTSVGRLGVLVCWDQWYPEAARLMALAGADILLYPTAIGWEPGDPQDEKDRQLASWQTIQRSHAIANGLPVAACNRVGHEPGNGDGIDFWGHSFVCGPQGEILWQSGTDAEIGTVKIDRTRSEKVRRIWPFFRDRRIDAYDNLINRFQ